MSTTFVSCQRCNGRGFIGAFAKVANGVCFDCQGAKGRHIDTATAKAKANEAKRKAAKAKRTAAREAQLADLRTREEAAIDALEALVADDIAYEAFAETGRLASLAQTTIHEVRDGNETAEEAYAFYCERR